MKTMHIRCLVLSIAFVLGLNGVEASAGNCRRQPDRKYWVEQLVRIAGPVYENLSRNTLRRNMPVETNGGYDVPGNNRKGRISRRWGVRSAASPPG